MRLVGERSRRGTLATGIGVALLLVYVAPVFFPPAGRPFGAATVTTSLVERLFPSVPTWWMLGRLGALVIGACLVAWSVPGGVFRWPAAGSRSLGTRPWALGLACVAAAVQFACLPLLRQIPIPAKTIFLLWAPVPALILLFGGASPRGRWSGIPDAWRAPIGFTAALITGWFVLRIVVSWHSPIAADCSDMFRTLGGLIRLATTDADFMTESMGVKEGVGDIEVRGVNAVQLFFEGLPLLHLFSLEPCMGWMQVFNAIWLATAAAIVGLLCATLVGPTVLPVAVGAFLFSPYVLMCQLLPVPTVCFVFASLLVTLPVRFQRSGSPATLALFGAVAGLSAMIPSLTPTTGLALLVVAWRLWSGPRVPALAVVAAALSFVALAVPNIPSREALDAAYDWYVLKHWPWATGELTLQGQISPSEASWTTIDPPGPLPIALGSLLSPIGIPRNSLRNWGDVLFDPVGAALGFIGLLVCLRQAARDRTAWYLPAFLATAVIPGFVSSYDRTSLTRIYAETVPLAILAAGGLLAIVRTLRSPAMRRWAPVVATVAIAGGGIVVFDVVNPRILSASTWGLLMRSVEPEDLDRVVMLSVDGSASNPPDVDPRHKLWEADWLRQYHPYIDDLARCAPRRPVPILPVQNEEAVRRYDLLFWNPALDQTAEITRRWVCRRWPDASLYTITDFAGLSRVHVAQTGGVPWVPAVPQEQWVRGRCGPDGEPPEIGAAADASAERGPT